VKLLLDTHIWLWSRLAPEKLSKKVDNKRVLLDRKSVDLALTDPIKPYNGPVQLDPRRRMSRCAFESLLP
jgi:hypothetical protein